MTKKSFLLTSITAIIMTLTAILLQFSIVTAQEEEECTEAQLRAQGVIVVSCNPLPAENCTTVGTVSSRNPATSEYLSITYPEALDSIPDLAQKIDTFIASKNSTTPWNGLGSFIIEESKKYDVNPVFIVATGRSETGFRGSSSSRYNYFGIKNSSSTYRQFTSAEEGIAYFISTIPEYLSGERSGGRYQGINTVYEYSSIHQTGSVVYPGEPFDPNDIDEKKGNTQDLWDPAMAVYVSWDENANNRPEVNPKYKGNVYNPLNYYKLNIETFNGILGLNLPDTPGGVTAQCGSLTAGASGWDLPGEGANPMVYYSQRRSGDDTALSADALREVIGRSFNYPSGYFGNDNYGPGPIAHCGCGPTSWAMIVSTLTGEVTTPTEVAEWANENGWQSDGDPCGGSNWWWNSQESSEAKWKVSATPITISDAPDALRSGSLILVSAGSGPFTSGGHLLVMRAVTDDGKFLFADPNDYRDTRQAAFNVFNGESKSRTPLSEEQFIGSIKGLWEVKPL